LSTLKDLAETASRKSITLFRKNCVRSLTSIHFIFLHGLVLMCTDSLSFTAITKERNTLIYGSFNDACQLLTEHRIE